MRRTLTTIPLLVLVACGSSKAVKPTVTRGSPPPPSQLVVNAPLSDSPTTTTRVAALLGRWVLDRANTSAAFGKIGVLTFGRDGRVRARAGEVRDSGSWRFDPDGKLRISGLGEQTLMFELVQVDANHLDLVDEAEAVVHLSADRALSASTPLALIADEKPSH